MSKNNHIINSFIAGECSPKFLGRTEATQYNQSCEDLYNAIVYPQGGAGRRPGTHLIKPVADLADMGDIAQVRVIPMLLSNGERWQILITDLDPTADHAISPLKHSWKAINVATHEVRLINTDGHLSTWDTFISPTPAFNLGERGVDLKEIQYAQSGDTLVLVHPKFKPIRIKYDTFGGAIAPVNAFVLYSWIDGSEDAAPFFDFSAIPFDPITQNAIRTFTVTLVGSDYTIASSSIFPDAPIGAFMRFSKAGETIVLRLTSMASATVANAEKVDGAMSISPTVFGNAAGTNYEFPQWSDNRGWPFTVTFFEGRSVFGGNKTYPDTEWFSKATNIYRIAVRLLEQDPDFADPVTAVDPFETTLKSEILNEIRWMLPNKNITTGTNSREFVVQGPDARLSIGPTNYQTQAETPHGSAYVQAVKIENVTVFLQRHRRALRELVYNFNEDSFQAANLNLIAEHIANKSTYLRDEDENNPDGYFTMLAIQQTPSSLIWALDSNGAFCGLTRERAQQVAAWHVHELGGKNVGGAPVVTSLSVTPTPGILGGGDLAEKDELWMTVRRKIKEGEGYVDRFFIEKLGQDWERKTIGGSWELSTTGPSIAPVYMDCTTFHSSADYTDGLITDLPYSEDDVVSVICNGFYFGEYTVPASKTIDISDKLGPFTEWKVMIGFNYLAYIVPVTPETPAQFGSSQGLPRKIEKIAIHFYRSLGVRFGRKESDTEEETPAFPLEEISFPDSFNMATPRPMFTGTKVVNFPAGYEVRPRIQIESFLPYPMQITHIVAKQVVYEE